MIEHPEAPDPTRLQRYALETIKTLIKKSEGKQQVAIDKLAELIKKVLACQSSECKSCQEPGQRQAKQQNKSQPSAQKPDQSSHVPNTDDPDNTFRSRAKENGGWGPLPPRVSGRRVRGNQVEYSAEFIKMLKEYMRVLANEE